MTGRRVGYRWTVVALLFVATTINYIDRQVLGILAPTLQREIGCAVLLITHDPNLAKKADRMLTMNKGQLTEAAKVAVPA